MLLLNNHHKSKIVELRFVTKIMIWTRHFFKGHFLVKTTPSRNVVLSLTEKFKTKGSVSNVYTTIFG